MLYNWYIKQQIYMYLNICLNIFIRDVNWKVTKETNDYLLLLTMIDSINGSIGERKMKSLIEIALQNYQRSQEKQWDKFNNNSKFILLICKLWGLMCLDYNNWLNKN